MTEVNDVSSLGRVFSRISLIEQRFGQTATSALASGTSGTSGSDFPLALSLAKNAAASPASAVGNANSGDIIKMIQLAAKQHNVDPKLAQAVAHAESDYSPDAVSSTGAVGVMQLMPETAQSLGVRNISDPRENIDGGVQYLKQLLTTFQGDVSKAVAAYNAGPAAVENYQGVPPYAETQNYVAKVLSYYRNS
jgi:soluble lytic murein transglycosylase-like protein